MTDIASTFRLNSRWSKALVASECMNWLKIIIKDLIKNCGCSFSPCSRVNWSSRTRDLICSKCEKVFCACSNRSNSEWNSRWWRELCHQWYLSQLRTQHNNGQPGFFFSLSVPHCIWAQSSAVVLNQIIAVDLGSVTQAWKKHSRGQVGYQLGRLGSCRHGKICLVCVKLLRSCEAELKRWRFSCIL